MDSSESVQDFIARAEYIHGNLKDIGVVLDEATLVAKIVSGLTSEYTNFMSNWCGTDDSKQTLAHLLPRLMAEEQIRSGSNHDGESALYSRTLPSQKKTKKYQGSKGDKKKNSKCFICKEKGHWKSECPNRGKRYESSRESSSAIVAVSNSALSCDEWILD